MKYMISVREMATVPINQIFQTPKTRNNLDQIKGKINLFLVNNLHHPLLTKPGTGRTDVGEIFVFEADADKLVDITQFISHIQKSVDRPDCVRLYIAEDQIL